MIKYDETSDPLSDLPQHPRGIIGAMIANKLLAAGWKEVERDGQTLWEVPADVKHTSATPPVMDLEDAALAQSLITVGIIERWPLPT